MQLAALAHTKATQAKPTEAVMEPMEQETQTTKHATAAAVEEAETSGTAAKEGDDDKGADGRR